MDETRLNETMICKHCGKPSFAGPAGYAAPQCICSFTTKELITAAAWHVVQRDTLLRMSRQSQQLELPLETSETFKHAWSDYRNGQRTMLHSVLTFLNLSGYDTVAEKVRKHFVDSQNG